MTTDIEPTREPEYVPVRSTGEAVNVADRAELDRLAAEAPEQLAEVIELMDEGIRHVQGLRADVCSALVARMDRDATQTIHAGAYKLTTSGASDEVEVIDPVVLLSELSHLVDERVISDEALAKAVKLKPEVGKAGVNALRKLYNPVVTEAIAKAASTKLTRRRVTVSYEGAKR